MSNFVLLMAMIAASESALGDLGQRETLELRSVVSSEIEVPKHGRFELTLDLGASFDNPFDPDDVDVYAVFTPPEGPPMRVNGFYTVACLRKLLENGAEQIEPTGAPFWQIRFCPNREGMWHYRVFARDRTGTVESPEAAFRVVASENPGLVQRREGLSSPFVFDDGRAFFPVGENMCWGGPKGSLDFDEWLKRLGEARGNWIRLWMTRWNCALEWTEDDASRQWPNAFRGLGVYNLCSAWKLDTILDTAEKNGVYVQLCLGTYGEFTTGGYFNEGMWASNPYNSANGGPCASADDFWTNEQARRLYQRRLRYIAARYGARVSIFAWEFWNEARAPAAWVSEMAQYMKGTGPFEGKPADPYGHLVSTTYGDPDVWGLAEIDFTQTHQYGEGNIPDMAPAIVSDARRHSEFGKPHLMAEFGIDWRSSDDKYDPQYKGVNLHNAIWASALAGNAGSAMIWYWDSYIHPGDLYAQYAALRAFTDKVPWTEGQWQPLDVDPPRIESGTETWRDLTIVASADWGRNPYAEFIVNPLTGTDDKPLPKFLFGPFKPDLRVPLVFRVKYDAPGAFSLRVGSVSNSARLTFSLDGATVREVGFSASPPADGTAPEYESTTFRPEYGIYQAQFNKDYGIDVPAGEHVVSVDVTEGDWVGAAQYTFGGYVSSRFPRVNVVGLCNGTKALLWVQNADHNWVNVQKGVPVEPIHGAATALHGLPSGRYTCQWWDTCKGTPTCEETLVTSDGVTPLALPDLPTDAAACIAPEDL